MQEHYTKNKLYKFDRESFCIGPAKKGTNRAKLKKEFIITLWDGRIITIPKGFEFDGASFPRLLMFVMVILSIAWALFSPGTLIIILMLCLLFFLLAYTSFNPKYMIAACVHDRLYKSGEVLRPCADEVFADILRIENNNLIRVAIMFAGVRAGGWIGWNRYRKVDKTDDSV